MQGEWSNGLRNGLGESCIYDEENETDLIASVSKTPFLSFPNVNQVKKAMEIHADAENLKEVNGVAIMLYDLIEKSATDVLTILK